MRDVIVSALLAAGALLLWAGVLMLLRAGLRLAQPRLLTRPGAVRIAVMGRPWASAAAILAVLVTVAAWAIASQPLWGEYASDVLSYRAHGRGAAAALRSELMAAGELASTGRLGAGNLIYKVSSPGESTQSIFSYHWHGAPATPPPTAPVGLRTVAGDKGVYGLTYDLDIEAERLVHLTSLLQQIAARDAAQPSRRVLGTDLSLLIGSVKGYWQGFFGYVDNPAGLGRLVVGLPALLPMAVTGMMVSLLP